MKASRSVVQKKVLDALTEKNYLKAKDLASKCRCSTGTIYNAVRRLRQEQAVAIQPTRHGYVLSESAKKSDDVEFLRRINGRRTSDTVSLTPCIVYMKRRWRGIEGETLDQILIPLRPSLNTLGKGLRLLEERRK